MLVSRFALPLRFEDDKCFFVRFFFYNFYSFVRVFGIHCWLSIRCYALSYIEHVCFVYRNSTSFSYREIWTIACLVKSFFPSFQEWKIHFSSIEAFRTHNDLAVHHRITEIGICNFSNRFLFFQLVFLAHLTTTTEEKHAFFSLSLAEVLLLWLLVRLIAIQLPAWRAQAIFFVVAHFSMSCIVSQCSVLGVVVVFLGAFKNKK